MIIWEAVKLAFSNMTNFKGRANRREFILFLVFDLIVFAALFPLANYSNENLLGQIINFPVTAIGIFLFIPSVSLIMRRFHDIEWKGLWLVVPAIGTILMIPLLILWLIFSIFYFLTGLVGLVVWVFFIGLLPITLLQATPDNPMFYLVLGVPIGIYCVFALILCCLKGEAGQNKYGQPSLNLYTEQYFTQQAQRNTALTMQSQKDD